MRGGCLGQIITWFIIGSIVLWFIQSPESVAGLFNGFFGLAGDAGNAIGRFMSALAFT